LRFTLLSYLSEGRDINLDVKKVEANRKFCNKIWNAFKISNQYLGNDYQPGEKEQVTGNESNVDKWIINSLFKTIDTCVKAYDIYDFSTACNAIHSFFLYDFCDIYIEAIKPIMNNKQNPNLEMQNVIRNMIYICMDNVLRLLSPMMPFITEELWQRLPRRLNDNTKSICVSKFPEVDTNNTFEIVLNEFELVKNIVHTIRRLRSNNNIVKKERPTLTIQPKSKDFDDLCKNYQGIITTLTWVKEMNIIEERETNINHTIMEDSENLLILLTM